MNIKQQTKQQDAEPEATVTRRYWFGKPVILLLSAAWVLAVIVRLSVRDAGGLVTTLIFYVSPLMLLTLVAGLVLVLCCRVRWWRLSLIWLLFTVITSFCCWQTQFQHHPVPGEIPEHQTVRVQFWNIGDRIWGMEHVLGELKSVDADLIGLVEAGDDSQQEKQFWKTRFPEHPYQSVSRGLVLLSRFPIDTYQSGPLASMGQYQRFDLILTDSRQSRVSVFLVDISSNILRSRQSALEELSRLVSQDNDSSVLLLGDFNTPTDSVHFDAIRKSLRNSMEVAGQGYTPTWPLPLPVLDLDGIWGNRLIRFLAAENRWTWVSDHRSIVVQFELDSAR